MYKNDIMYILVSTFGGIIRVNTRISCIHVQCLIVRQQWLCECITVTVCIIRFSVCSS